MNEKNIKIDIPCPICASNKNKVKYEPRVIVDDPTKLYGAASGIPGTQRIVECEACQMIFESPRYPEKVILKGYTNSEESGHDSQYPARVRSFCNALKSLEKKLPKRGSKVLDVGTAGGAFLEAAGQFGYDAVGLEPSTYLVNKGNSRGLNLKQGTIDTHPFESSIFDMICLWDVIEHIVDPGEALKKISPLLKPDGILLINFPDIGTAIAKLAGKRFWWILSVHLHYFTQKTLGKMCEVNGFDAFYFKRYWQTLEFGYLEDIAIHYRIPTSGLLKKLTPAWIQKMPIPYYASQTTALVRKIS